MWSQVYNPLGSELLSTLVAALPVVVLLALIASGKVKAHLAAVIALVVAILIAIFLYRLCVEKGTFELLQRTIGGVTPDRRLQLLLIAFAFGAFFEGASGFGTPVAVTGAMLMGLGFSPLAAAGLSLIANTAPVAYGALGTPIQ